MSPMRGSGGFTMTELVTVIIVIGILAAVAVPKLTDRPFDQRGFHDTALATVQHARRMAMAARRYTCVTVGSTSIAVTRDTTLPESAGAVNCTAAPALPMQSGGCAANAACAPSGVTASIVGAVNPLIFDPQGRPVAANRSLLASAATIRISAASQPNMDITINAQTGYVAGFAP